jgi:hypothetical protein
MSGDIVKVRVGWGVSFEGVAYSGGDTVEVPSDLVEQWVTSGFVELVSTSPDAKQRPGVGHTAATATGSRRR